MIIDQWLYKSISIMSQLPNPPYKGLLFPEFQISKLADNPARVEHKDFVTYITGSTDYAQWSFPKAYLRIEHEGKFSF
jgi:hypothetical protein